MKRAFLGTNLGIFGIAWFDPAERAGRTNRVRMCPALKAEGVAVELLGERMREQLNSNPLVQLAVVGVLLVGVAVFLMSGGGGEEEEAAAPEATLSTTTPTEAGPPAEASGSTSLSSALSAVGDSPLAAPPPPRPVLDAWQADKTLVLLFVRDGGIDDRLVKAATDQLEGFRDAAVFIVPAAEISRYATIAEGVGVDRVPALVVVRPKSLKKTVPTASVSYGFRSEQSIAQAVIDAGYQGKTLDYHP